MIKIAKFQILIADFHVMNNIEHSIASGLIRKSILIRRNFDFVVVVLFDRLFSVICFVMFT